MPHTAARSTPNHSDAVQVTTQTSTLVKICTCR